MKEIKINVNGQFEEEIALEIIQGVYAAISNHGYTDVSVEAQSVSEKQRELQVPSFLTQYTKGREEVQEVRRGRM